MVRALSHVLFFNPGPERRVPFPNRYIAVAKFCFCKNNKRMIDRRVQSVFEEKRNVYYWVVPGDG
jgi:hypothetical protein